MFRRWLIVIWLIRLIPMALAQGCVDIHLKDGRVIAGVRVEYEDIYDQRYVIYSYRNDATPHRLPMLQVRQITAGECKDGVPKPTPMTLPDSPQSDSGQTDDLTRRWNTAVEILADGNDIRRKKRWKDEIVGRYVRACGAVRDVEAGRVTHRVKVAVSGATKDSDQLLVQANVPKGREGLLETLNIDDAICVTGRISDSRHVGTRRADETDEFLLELENLMDPTKLIVDVVIDDCRVERGKESDKPVLDQSEPRETPLHAI